MVGVLLPGFALRFDFEIIAGKGILTIPDPKQFTSLGLFLNAPLADPNTGGISYPFIESAKSK